MIRSKLYLAFVLLMAAVGFASCSDNFDAPPMVIPSTSLDGNISIYELKKQYYNSATNYIDTIGFLNDDNVKRDSLYIKGRVVSSDESGNIYKNLVIQDESAAITLSINANSLYNNYRRGQEIVLSVSELYMGKYNGLQQLGYPDYDDRYGWQATFMPLELFESRVHLNGLPDVSKIDTLVTTLAAVQEMKSSTDEVIRMQSRLVRFNNVRFVEADGETTFSESESSTSRHIEDESGNQIIVRNSNYASFKSDILPLGYGSIVGILSWYGNDGWQLMLRDADDCIGFRTGNEGTASNPYTVEQAIELQGTGNGWVTGYVVGAVGPNVTTVGGNDDIEWQAPTTLGNTLVIGATADTRDISQCLVISLPQNSAMRQNANLVDNPQVWGTQIWVSGTFASYMGTYGIVDNSGSASEYKLSVASSGVSSLEEGFENSGSDIPEGWQNVVVSGDKDWYVTDFNDNHYAAMTGYKGTQPPFESWLITPALNIDDAESKVFSFRTQVAGYGTTTTEMELYVLSSTDLAIATKTEITDRAKWPDTNAGSPYTDWVESGDVDLSDFSGSVYVAFRYVTGTEANYATWCVDDVKFGVEGSGGGGDTPSEAITATRADFETLNDGSAVGFYGSYTSADGWTAAGCNVLKGAATTSNPEFEFIGFITGSTSEYAMAPCMNGRTSQVGSIVSPTIANGCGTLSFNYGKPYTDNTLSFRVDIVQNGSVVKTFTVTDDCEKTTAYSHSEDINVSGEFSIEFHNLSPSNDGSRNCDRVCIWNVSWTNYQN